MNNLLPVLILVLPFALAERCNKEEICKPYTMRQHHSLDFLCCEDESGWVAAHVTNPLALYMYTGNLLFSAFSVLFFELVEALGQLLHIKTGNETVSGSLLGDVFHGFLGILIGFLLRTILESPKGLWPTLKAPWQLTVKYLVLGKLHWVSYLLFMWNTETCNYGLIVATILQFIWILVVLPIFTQLGDADEIWVWRGYPKDRRMLLFVSWIIIVLAIHFQATGFHYLDNDWYQVWVSVAAILLVEYSFLFFKTANESRRLAEEKNAPEPWKSSDWEI